MRNVEFKIGEIILPNKDTNDMYNITNARNGFVGSIVRDGDEYQGDNDPNCMIEVRCEEFSDLTMCCHIGDKFWVEKEFFYPQANLNVQDVCVNDLLMLLEG